MRLLAIQLSLALFLAFPITKTFAQTESPQQPAEKKTAISESKLSVKLFEIRYKSPSSLSDALIALSSGAPGTMMKSNGQLRTLTVRDFPENIAAIEEALRRLDIPEPPPVSLECQLHLVSASMVDTEKSQLPKTLEPVVAQLRSTLKFTNYRYVSSTLNRISDGGSVESNGLTGTLFPTPSGVINTPDNPTFYQYALKGTKLTQDASGKEAIQIEQFKFGASVPLKLEGNKTIYKDIGLQTPLTLRESEMAAVGTVNISRSDEAIIVIVSVKRLK
jgi:hypothetical protein